MKKKGSKERSDQVLRTLVVIFCRNVREYHLIFEPSNLNAK